jgi:hypothetical protein
VVCLVFMLALAPGEAQAQREKTIRTEKRKTPKIKSSGKGEKGVSNRAKIRENRQKTRSRQGEKATRGDITGRRIKSRTSPPQSKGGYSSSGVPGQTRTSSSALGRKRVITASPPRTASASRPLSNQSPTGFPIKGRTASSARKTSYPKSDPYKGRKPQSEAQRAQSNKSQLSGQRSVSGSSPFSGGRYRASTPRSASGNYVSSRRIRPYAGKQKTPWERSTNRDIAGKSLRTKNFESARPPISRVTTTPRTTARGRGDQAFKGKSPMGGVRTATRKTETSTNKDIAGRKLRQKNASSLPKTMSGPVPNVRTASKKKEGPFQGKSPYSGPPMSISKRGEKPQGPSKAQSRKLSVSGKQTGRAGSPLPSKFSGGAAATRSLGASGGVRYRKPLQGGGSMSAKMDRGNSGRALAQRYTGKQSLVAGQFRGTSKSKPLPKGGGSMTAKMDRGNSGQPLAPRVPQKASGQLSMFSGNVKVARKSGQSPSARYSGNIRRIGQPIKGGGSITPDMARNNGGKPIEQFIPKKAAGQSTIFAGNVKAPKKQIQSKSARYQGTIKAYPLEKGGGGTITPEMERDNKGKALAQFIPKKAAGQSTIFQGNQRAARKHRLNPTSPKDGLPAWSTNKRDRQEGQLTARVRQPKYKANPLASEESLKNKPASKATMQGGEYRGFLRQPTYSKNPHAAKDALKGIAASKSAKQGAAYQGDLKLRKYDAGKKHPSYYLSKKELNAKEEKEKTFKFRLWWAKLTNKTDEQPQHLKDNTRKPGYDKKEKGLWYY